MRPSSVSVDLPARIDHTILRPDATKEAALRVCAEARDFGFGVVFVPACYLTDAVEFLAGASVRIGIPIGFPLGSQTTQTKVKEAIEGFQRGATELDMVINIGRLKSGDYDAVRGDIAEVVRATPRAGHKVILETCYLTQEEKMTACELAIEAGADYVKTSTGFGPTGATVADVRLMKDTVAGRVRIKASGGIRSLDNCIALIEAGADRIGTSSGVDIFREWQHARMKSGEISVGEKGLTEHRKPRRVPVRFPVWFSEETVEGNGKAWNLSTGGCAVETETTVPVGTYLKMRLYCSDRNLPISIDVAAVRWSSPRGFGAEFVGMPIEGQRELQRFVADLQGTG